MAGEENFTFVQGECEAVILSHPEWCVFFVAQARANSVYVICNVDVGRAKGNLWQPNHKRMILCVKRMILKWSKQRPSTGKLTPEKSRSLLERSDEIWSGVCSPSYCTGYCVAILGQCTD